MVMEEITLNSKIARKSEIVTADMDGEIVMMHVETGNYFGLGNVGSVIWTMIENPLTVEEIITSLLDQYEIGKDQCEDEVLRFLNEMNTLNLLEVG